MEISVGVDYLSTEAAVACAVSPGYHWHRTAYVSLSSKREREREREGAVITIIVRMSHITRLRLAGLFLMPAGVPCARSPNTAQSGQVCRDMVQYGARFRNLLEFTLGA